MRTMLRVCFFVLMCVQAALSQTQATYAAQVMAANPDVYLNFSDAPGGFKDVVAGRVFAPSKTGTILYHQPSYILNSTAASLTYDATLTAPDNSVGNFDWKQAWWAIVDVSANVTRSPSIRQELFSKGIPNGNLSPELGGGVGYDAFLISNGSTVLPCLQMSSALPAGGISAMMTCSTLDIPVGFASTIAFTYDGSGCVCGMNIWVNGIGGANFYDQQGAPTNFSMATPGYPLMVNGDSTNYIALQTVIHNTAPTVYQAFAMGRGALSEATIQSFVVHDRFYAQWLPPPSAAPPTILFDDDGCADVDNLNALAMLIRLHQLGYIRLGLANNTGWTDTGPAVFRQMLDQGGLHHVPVSSSQGTWVNYPGVGYGDICGASNLTAYNATWLTRAQQMTDTVGYRTALAAAPDHSVEIVVGGALRGVYDLMVSSPDSISPLTGAQLFAAKVTAIHMQATIGDPGDGGNMGQDTPSAVYVNANANVPMYFYSGGFSFGLTGPGANLTRSQLHPYVQSLLNAGALTRQAWDSWPVLGAVDLNGFWDCGEGGTVVFLNSYAGSTFTPSPTGNRFNCLAIAPWSNPIDFYTASWFMNSLVNANPEPPVTQ